MVERLDPLVASADVEEAYKRYLTTLLTPREPALAAAYARTVERAEQLTQGPILELTPPYQHGATIRDLIAEGVLSPGFELLGSTGLPLDRPLYRHQEESVRKAAAGRNIVVTTGTGSGKTESFLIPILDSLAREHAAGTLGPGVRALLLYPMNALANDQVKRLRAALADAPHITFGRYTGETKETRGQAEAQQRLVDRGYTSLPNELLSRQEMRAQPPHILLTNYAMLEYMLLRPADLDLFEGAHAGHWRFLALDEAHVYSGAQGSEVALLLRRLRDRVAADKTLQCIATSASLDGEPSEVMRFASDLLDVPFEWCEGATGAQDLVTAKRVERPAVSAWGPIGDDLLFGLSEYEVEPDELDEALVMVSGCADAASALHSEATIVALRGELSKGPTSTDDICGKLWPDDPQARRRLDAIVALGSKTVDATGNPVLSARYHLFVRATEGAYTCLSDLGPHVQLGRFESCPQCEQACFEFGTCQRCGAVYLAGEFAARGKRRHFVPTKKPDTKVMWLVLTDEDEVVDEDDATLDTDDSANSSDVAALCMACGCLYGTAVARCDAPGCAGGAVRGVRKHHHPKRFLGACASCGGRAPNLIRRLHLGADAPAAVLTTALYQHLPPAEAHEPAARHVGEGRKLLMFSDSRQAAAFAAPYLDATYGRLLQRRHLTAAITRPDYAGIELTASDVIRVVERAAAGTGHFPSAASALERVAEVATWLMAELMAHDHRQSLEGLGVMRVGFSRPAAAAPPVPLLSLGLSADEAWAVLEELARTARQQGAMSVHPEVKPDDEIFAPRLGPIYLRKDASDAKSKILSWTPTRGVNTRIDYLRRVMDALGAPTARAQAVLDGAWKFAHHLGWFVEHHDRRAGVLAQVDYTKLVITSGLDQQWHRCSLCRRVTAHNVRGVCPGLRCEGTLEQFTPPPVESDSNHYRYLYRTMSAIPLAAMEHTAQWNPQQAAEVQAKFIDGEVNVLSCSTTFELGVDVGDLQSVLLRNMPPTTANYVQRAGRAGRRATSAALVVTYAQRRSHDITKFNAPIHMIAGKMQVPWVPVRNSRIGRRHAHSIALAAYFRDAARSSGQVWSTAADFFLPAEGEHVSPATEVGQFLTPVPPEVLASLKAALPRTVQDEIGVGDGRWVARLVAQLRTVEDELASDTAEFARMIGEAAAQQRFGLAEQLKKTLRTIHTRHLFGFLGSRNILPKYGFPVDTVDLRTQHSGDVVGRALELTRDLSQAIYEYAPGNQIVAGGRLWTSRGIYRMPGKDLDVHQYRVCGECGRFTEGRELDAEQVCVCGSDTVGALRKLVVPEFGFVCDRKTIAVGAAPPDRRRSGATYIAELGDTQPERNWRSPSGMEVHAVAATRATMVAVSEGAGSGFWLCEWCGWGAPREGRVPGGVHERPLTGEKCAKNVIGVYSLAHRYQTDIAEISFTGMAHRVGNDAKWWSALFALVEGASERLEISRDDIDGALSWSRAHGRSLVLHDTVPGGAGATRRIVDNVEEVLRAAVDRVGYCDCGIETSCYGCLRSRRNERHHEDLSRRGALDIFEALGLFSVAAGLSPQWLTALQYSSSPTVRRLLEAIAAVDHPVPEMGAEVGPENWHVEAWWPGTSAVLLADEDLRRDAWLASNGYTLLRAAVAAPADVARAIGRVLGLK